MSFFPFFVLGVLLLFLHVLLHWVAFYNYIKLPTLEPFGGYIKLAAQVTAAPLLRPPPPRPFDYFKLAQQWPPSVCKTNNIHCPRNFTIHGLWPNSYNGSKLIDCSDEPYVKIEDQKLRGRLNSGWPDLVNKDNDGFWKRQWRKHGTCAYNYTQTPYFTKALELRDRYDLLKALIQRGITPSSSKSYNKQSICDAIKAVTSTTPELKCKNQTLLEIYVCFEPQEPNAVINCSKKPESACPLNINFPKFS